MQIYDFTVAVNAQRQLDAPGTYFYYLTGNAGGADQTITLRGVSSGLRIVLKPGQSMRLPQGASPETSWYIGNNANAAKITGTVIVGLGEIQDNRISGDVSVIDSAKNQVLAGLGYAITGSVTPIAAQQPYGQIFNPSATKNLVVEAIAFSTSTAANSIRYGLNTAALASVYSTGVPATKLSAGPASVGVNRFTNSAALPTGYIDALYMNIQGSTPYFLAFKKPFIVKPGNGFCIGANIANSDLQYSIDFYEDPI